LVACKRKGGVRIALYAFAFASQATKTSFTAGTLDEMWAKFIEIVKRIDKIICIIV
jgi:hypothetical protein